MDSWGVGGWGGWKTDSLNAERPSSLTLEQPAKVFKVHGLELNMDLNNQTRT